MITQRDEVFQIKRTYVFLCWFSLLLLLPTTVVVPVMLATDEQPYPNLNSLLISYAVTGLVWLLLLAELGHRTARIDLHEHEFTIRKFGQKVSRHPYTAILNYNERPSSSKVESFSKLTVYLSDNWFVIRSTEFKEYDYLKKQFTQHGEPVSRRNVLTLTERNRLRWMIAGGIFFVSRKHYEIRLDGLRSAITLRQPITLRIRESYFRKNYEKPSRLPSATSTTITSRSWFLALSRALRFVYKRPRRFMNRRIPTRSSAHFCSAFCCCSAGRAGLMLTASTYSGRVECHMGRLNRASFNGRM